MPPDDAPPPPSGLADGDVLDRRTLNRATLARQLLLERDGRSAAAAIAHLIALQAQEPHEPYVGLWSRIEGFTPPDLEEMLHRRAAVRGVLMRRTLHLVAATDAPTLRGLHDRMLRQSAATQLRQEGAADTVDLDRLVAAAVELLGREPMISGAAARALTHHWPDAAGRGLANVLATVVPTLQTTPRGLWGVTAPATLTSYDAWIGRPPEPPTPEAADELVLRYLRAFGPAATADVRAWSGMSGLPDAVKRLEPRLRRFRDERGRTLWDVPGGPLPAPETPAPVRFVPAFDNVVLGYADRSRVIDDADKPLSVLGTRFVLVDGRVAGSWTTAGEGRARTLEVTTFRTLRRPERAELREEGERLLAFLADGARTRGVRMSRR